MADLTCGAGGSTSQEVLTDINANTEAIAGLLDLNYFEFDSRTDILDIDQTYQEVASLDIPDLKAGVYLIGISDTYTFTETNKSVYGQMILNGNSEVFSREPKDSTDREVWNYLFPYTHAADGAFTMTLLVRKEDNSGTLDVLFSNMWIDAKAELGA